MTPNEVQKIESLLLHGHNGDREFLRFSDSQFTIEVEYVNQHVELMVYPRYPRRMWASIKKRMQMRKEEFYNAAVRELEKLFRGGRMHEFKNFELAVRQCSRKAFVILEKDVHDEVVALTDTADFSSPTTRN